VVVSFPLLRGGVWRPPFCKKTKAMSLVDAVAVPSLLPVSLPWGLLIEGQPSIPWGLSLSLEQQDDSFFVVVKLDFYRAVKSEE
jgi:hypothetical protein